MERNLFNKYFAWVISDARGLMTSYKIEAARNLLNPKFSN